MLAQSRFFRAGSSEHFVQDSELSPNDSHHKLGAPNTYENVLGGFAATYGPCHASRGSHILISPGDPVVPVQGPVADTENEPKLVPYFHAQVDGGVLHLEAIANTIVLGAFATKKIGIDAFYSIASGSEEVDDLGIDKSPREELDASCGALVVELKVPRIVGPSPIIHPIIKAHLAITNADGGKIPHP